MKLTPSERARAAAAVHEAGHAVAGVLLGGQIEAVTVPLDPGDGPLGWTQYAHPLTPDTDAAVTYAGPWAEARWRDGDFPARSAVRAALAANCSDADALADLGGPLPQHVEPLLRRCWGSITTLAAALYRTGHAGHADVCAALQIPENDNATGLAAIRSGSVPGFRITPPGLNPP